MSLLRMTAVQRVGGVAMPNYPKSASDKALAGNPGNRKLNESEPKPVNSVPKCPRHLDSEAKREWKRISSELDTLGLLTRVDRAALAAYCAAWSRWAAAEKVLRKEGLTFSTPRGYVQQRPEVGIANTALSLMKAYLTEFGMTPGSRSRVVATPKEDDSDGFF
jgi:P27 family predicted phage terminase small subunit